MFNLFTKSRVATISPLEVKKLLNNQDVQIIDVRSQEEYNMRHIPNSKLIPLPNLPSNLHLISKEQLVITVCASGARSQRAAEFLSDQGYQVKNMSGGMMRW